MNYKFYVYVNSQPNGKEPKLEKLLETEQDKPVKPGDIMALEHDGPVRIMAFEVDQIPGTNEFIILGGRPFPL